MIMETLKMYHILRLDNMTDFDKEMKERHNKAFLKFLFDKFITGVSIAVVVGVFMWCR